MAVRHEAVWSSLGIVLLLAACPKPVVAPSGGGDDDRPGGDAVVVTVATDGGAPAVETPVEPGGQGDVLGRVFVLGTAPSIASAFGKLRPGMSRADATKARPADWSSAWSHQLSAEPTVTVAAGLADGSDDPIQALTVTFDQAGAPWRLEQAWGPPSLRAYHGGMVCWVVAASRLKACVGKVLDHDVVVLGSYVPLADALGKGGVRSLAGLVKHLGAFGKDVRQAFPQAIVVRDEKAPTQNRLEVDFPTTEYMADVHPDRSQFYTDKDDRIHTISIRFGANDPALRPRLVEQVRAAADQLGGGRDALSITVLEDEPLDVVVVMDRTDPLE